MTFVVQKHTASHLHYDFRLEQNGVLKSWAIPKGPSINPTDKRLAIMVEDHPYTYKDFEGTIPKGNYSAGTVIVWDKGTHTLVDEQNTETVEARFQTSLLNRHLSFILNGEKLKGEFALVKLKIKQKDAGLLIKKKDQFASESDVLLKNRFVISGLTLEEIGGAIFLNH